MIRNPGDEKESTHESLKDDLNGDACEGVASPDVASPIAGSSKRYKQPPRKPMTSDEYFQFLQEYWEIFGPIPPPKPFVEYKNVRL